VHEPSEAPSLHGAAPFHHSPYNSFALLTSIDPSSLECNVLISFFAGDLHHLSSSLAVPLHIKSSVPLHDRLTRILAE
jgi:hypothetical protein